MSVDHMATIKADGIPIDKLWPTVGDIYNGQIEIRVPENYPGSLGEAFVGAQSQYSLTSVANIDVSGKIGVGIRNEGVNITIPPATLVVVISALVTGSAVLIISGQAGASVAVTAAILAILGKEILKQYIPATSSLARTATQHIGRFASPSNVSPEVMMLLQEVYGDLMHSTTVQPLTLNVARAQQGQTISFSGRGFTPNGRVGILFGKGRSEALAEVSADAEGNIVGSITVPANGEGGKWLLAAFDSDRLYHQLQQYFVDQSTNLAPYVSAATVDVPHKLYLPLIN